MRAKLLDLPPVVTDQERAEDFCDRLEQLLLEAGEVFPRADLRRRAAAYVRDSFWRGNGGLGYHSLRATPP